ncbi:jg27654 [Pararge aegeria aegeria]|uniref:Jg27654 protein n=1 Tax=Pararge aegeria aegeria TaxID=348720 RepID=A0A8S4RN86_9NEOP|nr:jg27654 [Pararge aegeria aegeria]
MDFRKVTPASIQYPIQESNLKVSTPKGTKMKLLSRFSYLRLLACSALEAAAPTIDEVAWMCDAARVSTVHPTEVTFQASKV